MKKIIAIVLAVVLVVGGLGGLAYAQSNSHEPMTGQKLVGYGFFGMLELEEPDDATCDLHTLFVFTNPDCVSEIMIDRVSIFAFDGTVLDTVLYEDPLKVLEPHEVDGVELHDYIDPQDPLMPVTVEIFWTGARKGLPLTGWAQTGYSIFDGDENLLEVCVGENPMVNVEQKLK